MIDEPHNCGPPLPGPFKWKHGATASSFNEWLKSQSGEIQKQIIQGGLFSQKALFAGKPIEKLSFFKETTIGAEPDKDKEAVVKLPTGQDAVVKPPTGGIVNATYGVPVSPLLELAKLNLTSFQTTTDPHIWDHPTCWSWSEGKRVFMSLQAFKRLRQQCQKKAPNVDSVALLSAMQVFAYSDKVDAVAATIGAMAEDFDASTANTDGWPRFRGVQA